MGRIDAVIDDELEQRVKIEVIKRYGGKKGDLTRAIEEALRGWVDVDFVGKLKAQATNSRLLVTEREEAVRMLGKLGYPALDALMEVANAPHLIVTERDLAREMAKRVLEMRGRTSSIDTNDIELIRRLGS